MADKDFELGKSDLPGVETREVPVGDSSRTGYFIAGTDIELEPQGYETAISEGQSDYTRTGYNVYDEEQEGIHVFSPTGEYEGFQYAPRKDGFGAFFGDVLETAGPILSLIPATAPYMAAVNAARAAKEGDWGKAILSALPAAGKFAGAAGAAADTVSAINEANKYAKVLKALQDKDLLSAAFQGADLAGISKVAGYDTADVAKAINLGRALESGDPMAVMRAGSEFMPKGAAAEEYAPTKDFDFKADYSLFPESDYQGLGLRVPTDLPEAFNEDGSVNYDLFDYSKFDDGLGLQMPKSGNIESMGGGQGLRLPVDGGYITEDGFVPESYTADLGDPKSFINKPAPGGDVSDAVKKAITTQAGQTQQGGGVDLAALMSLLGGQQPSPVVLSVPENKADIELMQDIFGPSLSAPSTGEENARADALARLLRS